MNAAPGTLVISLDFELYWGFRDIVPLEEFKATLDGTREAVPRILDLFQTYEIHATWATVGLLCCENKVDALRRAPAARPSYADVDLSPYAHLAELGDGDARYHFAPELVRRILETPHQELGTHTYSHYYCLEPGQSRASFREDLLAAARTTEEKHRTRPLSIVFPRDQVDASAVEVCREAGILAFRGTEKAWFRTARPREEQVRPLRRLLRLADSYVSLSGANTYPLPGGRAPLDLAASRFLRPYSPALQLLEPLRLRRIVSGLETAARKGEVFHLWWHPENFGHHTTENLAFLERVLRCFTELRRTRGMRSMTMAEAAEEALRRKG